MFPEKKISFTFFHSLYGDTKLSDNLVKKKGFMVGNVDTVVVAQEPKLSPFKKQIQQNISQILKINVDDVGIKTKTNEGLGDIGRGEAIACYAVVTVIAQEDK